MKQYVSKLNIKIAPNNKLAFNGSSNLIRYTEEFYGELDECKHSIRASLENSGCQFTVFNSDFRMLIELTKFIQSCIKRVRSISDKSIIKHNGIFKFSFNYKGVNLVITLTINKIK